MGSFSRAAAALHLTQPSLSRQVKLLEEELGQHLLERHGRGVVTTEAGAPLLGHAGAVPGLGKNAKGGIGGGGAKPPGGLAERRPPRGAPRLSNDLLGPITAP